MISKNREEKIKLNAIIAANIKREMKKRYITASEMSEVINLSRRAFYTKMAESKINYRFSLYEVKKIADELMLTVDELLRE